MTTISTGTTSTNAYVLEPDTAGNLVIKTGSTPTTAMTIASNQAVTFAGAATITGATTLTGGVSGALSVTGNLSFNSGYGSSAVAYGCRAWVNFDGTAAGTFAGGTSTVTRIVGSTTATVTTTTAHGLITGNTVYALTGVAAGVYAVTVLTSTTFTITTVATTALTAASITFAVSNIRASGNVSSVADEGTGAYSINFSTPMPDTNYAVHSSAVAAGATSPTNSMCVRGTATTGATNMTVNTLSVVSGASTTAGAPGDIALLFLSVFR